MLTRTASPQRNLQLGQLAGLLTDQSARALDVIAGSGAICADGGRLILNGSSPPETLDAVAAYLDAGYVTRMIRDLETESGTPVTDPDTTISIIASKLRFTDDHERAILAHFTAGGAMSAGGILHAVTSAAQTLDDADAAHDLEAAAIPAMHLAASL